MLFAFCRAALKSSCLSTRDGVGEFLDWSTAHWELTHNSQEFAEAVNDCLWRQGGGPAGLVFLWNRLDEPRVIPLTGNQHGQLIESAESVLTAAD